MSNTKQEKIRQLRSSRGWEVAIEQAQRGIAEAKDRIAKLERSIGVFRECQDRGEPWPGTKDLEESQVVVNDSIKRDARKPGVAEQH